MRTFRCFIEGDQCIEKLWILNFGVSMELLWEERMADVFKALMDIFYW